MLTIIAIIDTGTLHGLKVQKDPDGGSFPADSEDRELEDSDIMEEWIRFERHLCRCYQLRANTEKSNGHYRIIRFLNQELHFLYLFS